MYDLFDESARSWTVLWIISKADKIWL